MGDRKNKGKEGMHLLPLDALKEISKVYDFGATKYSKEFNNEWHGLNDIAPVVSQMLYTPSGCVVRVMKNNSGIATLSIENANGIAHEIGTVDTLNTKRNCRNVDELIHVLEQEINVQSSKPCSNDTVSLNNLLRVRSLKDALSAVVENTYTLITVIRQGNIEEYFVVSTTTVLDSLEMTFKELKKLLNISDERTLLSKSGKHNWEKGLHWNEGCAASLLRHLSEWSRGRDKDDESGLYHDIHIAFNAIALVAFRLRNIGKDDRNKG